MAITRTWSINTNVGGTGRRRLEVSATGTYGAASAEDIAAAIDAHVTAEHP